MTRDRGLAAQRRLSLLEARRTNIVHLMDSVGHAGRRAPFDEAGGGVDEVDRACSLLDRNAAAVVATLLDDNRLQVDQALERVAHGSYGICEDCGCVIPRERLHVLPEATRCVECQRHEDASGRSGLSTAGP